MCRGFTLPILSVVTVTVQCFMRSVLGMDRGQCEFSEAKSVLAIEGMEGDIVISVTAANSVSATNERLKIQPSSGIQTGNSYSLLEQLHAQITIDQARPPPSLGRGFQLLG